MALLFIPIGLLIEVYSVCLRIRKHCRSTLPDVAIIFVVLITVVRRWLRPVLAASSHSKINHSLLRRFHLIQIVIVTRVVHYPWPHLISLWPSEVYILADTAFDILQRTHDIHITPIHTFIGIFSTSCHPWHVDHALTAVTRLFERVAWLLCYSS